MKNLKIYNIKSNVKLIINPTCIFFAYYCGVLKKFIERYILLRNFSKLKLINKKDYKKGNTYPP